MKNYIGILVLLFVLSCSFDVIAELESPVGQKSSERGHSFRARQRPERMGRGKHARAHNFKEMSADEIIEVINQRGENILERIMNRYNNFADRIERQRERLGTATDRIEKKREKHGQEKVEKRVRARQKHMTKRYEKFVENVNNRKTRLLETVERRRQVFESRLEHLEPEERARVMSAYKEMRSNLKNQAEEKLKEIMERVKANYEKGSSL